MKIKYGSVFGNYRWDAEAEITAEQAEKLAPLGALQIAQRSPSSEAEKAMAQYDKRPKGFTRTDIPFDAKRALLLQTALEVIKVDNEEIHNVVTVTEYVPTEADVKMTDERNAYARNASKGSLPKLAEKVGYDGDLGSGAAAEAPVEFLRAIRAWSKEQIKNA